jgi:hypothetical protein
VKTTGHNAKTVSKPNTGLRALLRGPLRGKGSGARSVLLLVPVLVVAILAFVAAPALAAAPETPASEEVLEVTAHTAKLKGVLNPGKEGELGRYWFHYAMSATACKAEEEGRGGGGTAIKRSPDPVEGELTELLANTTYTFCLEAENEAGERAAGQPVTFKTPAGPPLVVAETVTTIGAGSATIKAEITPNGLPTSYHVEYVSQTQFQAHGWAEASHIPTSDAELPAISTTVRVSESLAGLQPETAYRYRYVATNTLGVVLGEELSFTTVSSASSSSVLPDGRVYELVSTSGSYGEPYEPTSPAYSLAVFDSVGPVEAAVDGEALFYVGETASSGGNGNQGDGEGNQWLARRSSRGWEDEVVSPRDTASGEEVDSVFQAFSPDLTSAIVESPTQPPLVPGAPSKCEVLYSRASGTGEYAALLTSTMNPGNCGDPEYAGSSEDQSQALFESEAALTANAKEATEVPAPQEGHKGGEGGGTFGEPCMYGCNLYDSVNGQLRLVNVLPGAEEKTVPNATFGGYAAIAKDETDFSNVISRDGSRIFWTDTQSGANMEHIYVLENGTQEVQVSGGGQAEYWTATPDGRYAYYTEAGQLWRFDTDTNTSEALTAPGSEVQGVIGINETGADGAYVYFVAGGSLASGATAKNCNADGCNLYLLHENASHEHETTFIAELAPGDNELEAASSQNTGVGDWAPNLGKRTAEVTPDGEHLGFVSSRSLTGYDNYNRVDTAFPIPQVFVYAAGDGQLVCATCSPTGSAPTIVEEADQAQIPVSEENNTYMRRWLSDDGNRVFFQTPQPLVSQDINGVYDVYEWEREGVGTCTVGSGSHWNEGCISLLSGGNSSQLSLLVDADATGENVFFEHFGQLGQADVPSDRNEMYDARTNGGFFQSALACTGTGCQGVPPAPPIFATPASVTFAGLGNFVTTTSTKVTVKSLTRSQKLARALKACHKDKRKTRRTRCETAAKRRYGVRSKKSSAKRAGNERRAK